jgi:hypothetical protein
MVHIREVTRSADYEDVPSEDDDQYTDEECEPGLMDRLSFYLPNWCSRRVMGKVYGRLGVMWRVAGNLAWIFTTTMLLVGLPVLFAYDREKSLQEQQLMGLPAPTN